MPFEFGGDLQEFVDHLRVELVATPELNIAVHLLPGPGPVEGPVRTQGIPDVDRGEVAACANRTRWVGWCDPNKGYPRSLIPNAPAQATPTRWENRIVVC